tara:strand:- start:631 stop:2706 length:2076 start_codon:yes stop_codon:yes gene_type:complete
MKPDTLNPYVGLRPFNTNESILFFGRQNQIFELLQRLHKYHFVAVVGSSGCGKSSLLRAGLIPALKAGYLVNDSNHWLISIMKPGQNPLYNLAESLLLQINPNADTKDCAHLVKQINEEGSDVIIDLLKPKREESNINFFLLIDQFEELFRFSWDKKSTVRKDEAIDFVNIMIELSRQSHFPFFVVSTMRSDFIGDCAQFYGLPEAMNQSQYLVPKLNRIQLKEVIEGPAKLYGGKINPILVSQLLNDLSKIKDELPLLQHTLMRLWNAEVIINQSGEIDLTDYEEIGGIEKALSKHADEALNSLSKEDAATAKQIFQALITIDENGRKIRRPALLGKLKLLTQLSSSKLLEIINVFIKENRSFLIISSVTEDEDQIIDISHESLIRQWERLSNWADEEKEAAATYNHLSESAKLKKLGKKDFLHGRELQLALSWFEKFKPTNVWASRYDTNFDASSEYLKTSKAKADAFEKKENMRKRRDKYMMIGIISLVIIAALSSVLVYSFGKKNKLLDQQNQQIQQALNSLNGAQDSIKDIINQSPSVPEETKTRLKNVQEQIGYDQIKLSKGLQQPNVNELIEGLNGKNIETRRSSLEQLVREYKRDPEAIRLAFEILNSKNRNKLTPEALVNVFYFLNATSDDVWTGDLWESAFSAISDLERSVRSGNFTMGPQARKQMANFKDHIKMSSRLKK